MFKLYSKLNEVTYITGLAKMLIQSESRLANKINTEFSLRFYCELNFLFTKT